MKPKNTAIWFVIAAMLFASIWFYQKHLSSMTAPDLNLVAGLRPADVTGVEIYPAGAPELSVCLTNGGWELEKPFAYPAQTAAIQALVEAVADLKPVLRFSAAEMSSHKNADVEFGFDNPQYSIVITAGDQQWQLRVGNKTAPGDGVYVRVVGLDGAFVTGTDWLQLLPHGATDWRDTSLVDAASEFDWINITNGTRAIELRRDPTNRLWRLIYPLQARADNLLITTALQQLRSAHISRFITDDPKADPATYGLQPPALDLRLGLGTNLTVAIQAGKSPEDSSTEVYARRAGWNTVVTIPSDILANWRGAVNDFRDPHLVDLTAPVAQIDVRGKNDAFTLQSVGSNDWVVAGQTYPVDSEVVINYLRQLTRLRVSEFEKDVVTTKDLQDFGLAPPAQMEEVILRAADTNNIIAALTFGAVETNKVFVKRADEGFVYAVTAAAFRDLPQAGWEFRDRRIWSFAETNVAQVTLRENGQARTLIRAGANDWSLAPGSQGIINPLAVEETVHELGSLTAVGWVGYPLATPEKYGFKPDNLSVAIELKTGEKLALDFGMEVPQLQTAVASVTLGDGRWAFLFPATTYQMVVAYLTIPPIHAQ